MRNVFKFFSTYAVKDYIQHIIWIPNNTYSLVTYILKSIKSVKTLILLKKSIFYKMSKVSLSILKRYRDRYKNLPLFF